MKFWKRGLALLMLGTAALGLTGCGGDDAGTPAVQLPSPPADVVPTISVQPAAMTAVEGAAATFSVTATGSGTLTYQWQRGGSNIAGATAASYTLAAVTSADNGASFRVVVSAGSASATSSAVVLTVTPVPVALVAPTINASPQSANALDGSSASLSVAVSGSEPLTYVWRRGGTAIADAANTPAYSTPALTLADSGAVYSVVVSNAAGTVTSAGATLTVNPVAPAFATAPAAVAVSAGQAATFSASATGSATLAYQWLRNGIAVAGATASSFTTAATTLADNGARFSVVVSNAGGSTTSADALLTVTSSAVAPSVATAPVSQTVAEGQAATFSVTVSGTAPLAYQWRRNGTDIAGATQASYTVAAAALADSTTRFSVRVANAAGSVTSTDAVLTVQPAASGLIGRAWAAGQPLETDDNAVLARAAGIADNGTVMVVFLKSNGTRNVLYATRGTPNGAGAAPTWTTPVVLDAAGALPAGNMTANNRDLGVAVAPGGNALAYWFYTAPCTASTYTTNTASTCRFVVAARYLAATGTWEAPLLVGSIYSDVLQAVVNDRGDTALRVPGWVRSGTNSYTQRRAVASRGSSDAAWRIDTFSDSTLNNAQLGLDGTGNLLLAAEATANATTDIVAYRGSAGTAFSAAQTLDTRGNAASIGRLALCTGGQQVVTWTQNNGTSSRTFAATSPSAAGAWTVTDLAPTVSTINLTLTVDDAGTAQLLDLYDRKRCRWVTGNWKAQETVPSPIFGSGYSCTAARSGDALCISWDNGGGLWASYDAGRNVMVQAVNSTSPGPGYVLGVNTINRNVGGSDALLSTSGRAAVTLLNGYDTLPSATSPAGDARSVSNLWGVVLK